MSKVWQFFDVLKEDKNKATCNLCQMVVSRGGFGKSASTSPLIIHLKRHHPEEFSNNFRGKGTIYLYLYFFVGVKDWVCSFVC